MHKYLVPDSVLKCCLQWENKGISICIYKNSSNLLNKLECYAVVWIDGAVQVYLLDDNCFEYYDSKLCI